MPDRFPPPWTVTAASDEAFMVMDANGFPLAYVYCPVRKFTGTQSDAMTRDQARKIALNIAKLPKFLIK